MGAIRFSIDEKLLKFFAQHLPLEIFVETGSFEGETLLTAEPYFKACFSVDNNKECFERASQRHEGKENIFLEFGDSKEFIANIIEHVSQSCALFWLDAHDVSNAINPEVNGMDAQSPLINELTAIGHLNEQSVIVIDDAHLYLNTLPKPNALGRWPDFQDVVLSLLAMSEKHRIAVYDDTIVYYPEPLRAAFMQFAHENAVDVLGAMLDARSYREEKKKNASTTEAPKDNKYTKSIFGKFRK